MLVALVAAGVAAAAAAGVVASVLLPQSAPSPVLWSADMEDGTLEAWSEAGGGGEFNSGRADATVTTASAASGRHAARLAWRGPGESGTRLFRWRELHEHRELELAARFLLPRALLLRRGGWINLFQLKSTSADGRRNDPFWYIAPQPVPGARGLRLRLSWGWQGRQAGPRRGERGWRSFGTRHRLPVGRWFTLRARVRQSHGYDGRLRVWLHDGSPGAREVLLWDLRGVRTGYRSAAAGNAWQTDQGWSVNLYGAGLRPRPAVVLVDDARISR